MHKEDYNALEDDYDDDEEGEWIEYIDDNTQEPYYVNTRTGRQGMIYNPCTSQSIESKNLCNVTNSHAFVRLSTTSFTHT